MTFVATSVEKRNLESLDKSTKTKSSKQKFAHAYENGADFQNVTTCPRLINERCPMDTWTRQFRTRRIFCRIFLSHRILIAKIMARLICRARRRSHDTSRTTRHARHGTATPNSRYGGHPLRSCITPPTSDLHTCWLTTTVPDAPA